MSEMKKRWIALYVENDVVDVRVIGVDLKKKRIQLSMKGIS